MSVLVLTDAFVTVNTVDLSDHVKSVAIAYSAEEVDDTAMGDSTRSATGGLKNWGIDIEFFSDEASSNVAQTIFPLVGATTAMVVRPTSSAKSATNPEYSGTALVTSFSPVAGGVGDMAMSEFSCIAAGDLSRSV